MKDMSSLTEHAGDCHRRLPGLVRATLEDFGVSGEIVDRHGIGWDGDAITVPVRTSTGSVSFVERWDPTAVGVPIDKLPMVGLFGWQMLQEPPGLVVIAEGIHEALVLESQGFDVIAASGTGRFFKRREWLQPVESVPEVLIAFKSGERRERRHHLMSRREVVGTMRAALGHAEEIAWPNDFERDQGALHFFATLGRTKADFLALPRL